MAQLKKSQIPFGIATSGTRPGINPSLDALGIDKGTIVIEGKRVAHPKPEPDELVQCQQELGVDSAECFVVGDAVWDLLAAARARMFSVGLLTGGCPAQELFDAGRTEFLMILQNCSNPCINSGYKSPKSLPVGSKYSAGREVLWQFGVAASPW